MAYSVGLYSWGISLSVGRRRQYSGLGTGTRGLTAFTSRSLPMTTSPLTVWHILDFLRSVAQCRSVYRWSWTVQALSRNQWGGVGARILAFGEASREGFFHAGNFVEFLLGGAECLFYSISPPQQKLKRYPPVTAGLIPHKESPPLGLPS